MFKDEFIPTKEDAVRSILDYAIDIFPLADEEKQVVQMIVWMKMLTIKRHGPFKSPPSLATPS